MKNKTILLSTALCLLPIFVSIMLYNKLPEQVAVHFDNAGNPNGYLPKAIAAFGLPLFFTAINLYSRFRIATEPKAEKTSSALRALAGWTAPLLSIILVPVTLYMAMGVQIPVVTIISVLVSAAIIISGNYLPKCKKNYSIGIKLPWTLDDENNWNHTHRFAGYVWVIGGIVSFVNAFIQIPYVTIAVIVCLVALPSVYSYLFYRKTSVSKFE